MTSLGAVTTTEEQRAAETTSSALPRTSYTTTSLWRAQGPATLWQSRKSECLDLILNSITRGVERRPCCAHVTLKRYETDVSRRRKLLCGDGSAVRSVGVSGSWTRRSRAQDRTFPVSGATRQTRADPSSRTLDDLPGTACRASTPMAGRRARRSVARARGTSDGVRRGVPARRTHEEASTDAMVFRLAPTRGHFRHPWYLWHPWRSRTLCDMERACPDRSSDRSIDCCWRNPRRGGTCPISYAWDRTTKPVIQSKTSPHIIPLYFR